MKTSRLITPAQCDRRRPGLGRRACCLARYSEGSAADLRQPAAHGRQPHLRRPSRAAAGPVAGEGIQPGDITSFPGHRHHQSRRSRKPAARRAPTAQLQSGGVRRLAAVGRGARGPAGIVLARRPESARRRARRSRGTPARRAGPPSANGRACRSAVCSTRRASCRRRGSSSSTRSTTGSTASTCSTPCIRRRCWPTA